MNNDLKDVILQTLEEVDKDEFINESTIDSPTITLSNKEFLLNLREKILVLFEGLQSPNVTELDKKVDLIINFLEFTLAEIDKQVK